MSSSTLYSKLKDNDKQRLAVAFMNARDQKSIMAKVDWDSASLDFKPSGDITGVSFKTSINRMKHTYSTLTPSDKARLAACFTSIKDPLDRLTVMGNIEWATAANQFQPLGSIKGASFRTSISRILSKNDSSASGATGTACRKRKSTAANPSPPASGSKQGRKEKAKVNQVAEAEEEDATRSTSAENRGVAEDDLPQPSASSKASSPFRLVKTEDGDTATYGGDELSEEEPQFFPE